MIIIMEQTVPLLASREVDIPSLFAMGEVKETEDGLKYLKIKE